MKEKFNNRNYKKAKMALVEKCRGRCQNCNEPIIEGAFPDGINNFAHIKRAKHQTIEERYYKFLYICGSLHVFETTQTEDSIKDEKDLLKQSPCVLLFLLKYNYPKNTANYYADLIADKNIIFERLIA